MDLKVSITEESVLIGNLEFLHDQARDNCRCETCWNTSLQQRRKNPPSECSRVVECHIEQDIAHVTWSDGHRGFTCPANALEMHCEQRISPYGKLLSTT